MSADSRRDLAPAESLRVHGDAAAKAGLCDLAVNTREGGPCHGLREHLTRALDDVGSYPDPAGTVDVVAAAHGVSPAHVLLTAGATEAFSLIARAARVTGREKASVVHPQFSEPERALRSAGCDVSYVMTTPEDCFELDARSVPSSAQVVAVGNPTNPTGALHQQAVVRNITAPGRWIVVDEAFMDYLPGEAESAVALSDHGVLVVRSLTKSWGVPGIRIGYVIAAPEIIAALAREQAPWSVSALALAVARFAFSPAGRAEHHTYVARTQAENREAITALRRLATEVAGLRVFGGAAAPFVLLDVPQGEGYAPHMAEAGWAIRSCESFPGLGPSWWRLAVRDAQTMRAVTRDMRAILSHSRPPVGKRPLPSMGGANDHG